MDLVLEFQPSLVALAGPGGLAPYRGVGALLAASRSSKSGLLGQSLREPGVCTNAREELTANNVQHHTININTVPLVGPHILGINEEKQIYGKTYSPSALSSNCFLYVLERI